MIVVGIDSGVTGGIAFLNGASASVHDMPVRQVQVGEKMRSKLDAYALACLLRKYCPVTEPSVVYLEQLHARAEQGTSGKKNSMQSQGGMMEMFGGISATLAVLRMKVVPVYPQSWKRIYKLGSDKDAARAMAQTLFKDLQDELKRVKDDGRAEAQLIARYGQGKLS